MNYDSMNPVCILIHFGAPNDAKLFDEIIENLQKRRIIQTWDTIIFNKSYYSYKNHQLGISKYKIVPFIFPKESSKNQSLMTNYLIHHKYLRKQRKYWPKNNFTIIYS